jgi:hypothetical protein
VGTPVMLWTECLALWIFAGQLLSSGFYVFVLLNMYVSYPLVVRCLLIYKHRG